VTEPLRIDQYSIVAAATRVDERTRVLKQGETLAVFDRFGDVVRAGAGELGLYHEGTRYLDQMRLMLGDARPLLLSSSVLLDNTVFTADLSNPDVLANEVIRIPRGTLHVRRQRLLWNATWHERIHVANYGLEPIAVTLTLDFDADYADIFEVRGTRRARRGRLLPPQTGGSEVVFGYEGLDRVLRRTRIVFDPPPDALEPRRAVWELHLEERKEATLGLEVACESGPGTVPRISWSDARRARRQELEARRDGECGISSSNEHLNRWVDRSRSDLNMMMTRTPQGLYPFAGVPWFDAVFGRDGIITALSVLWANPIMARGVLACLAASQARQVDQRRDAEPGKILHEARGGEMAALGEVPFGRYYGSVDATPLFVMLAAAYYERSADLDFIREIWPNVESALQWMDTFGDPDGDGLVEYLRRSSHGLANQGWKDSGDSIFHADGALAEGPIALCEVQGYAFAARRGAALLARALGREDVSDRLLRQAATLQDLFERQFWIEDLATYALALDGRKRPCRVRTSNAGQVLLSGIASPERAVAVADTLLSDFSFSGFGIRTVDSREVRYNPMSYHDGSIWPHDNALIAAGLARYGLKSPVRRVFAGLFDAVQFMELHRMPELFCGFPCTPGEGPTQYPVACSPQSWAAASVMLVLQACLGLSVDAPSATVSLSYPVLPDGVDEVRISNLQVGRSSISLLVQRYGEDVGINVVRRQGEVGLVVVK
jgi:glycogen debranching enzyme